MSTSTGEKIMLTEQQIIDYRKVVSESTALQEFVKIGDDANLAKALSSILPKIPKPNTFVGERGIFSILGVVEGEAFLQTVEGLAVSNSPYASLFSRVNRWLKDPIGLDLGLQMTQDLLRSFSDSNGGPFKEDSIEKLITFGSQENIIRTEDVGDLR